MIAYVILERNGEWSAVRIDNPSTTSSMVQPPAPPWVDNSPMLFGLTGSTLDHAHQLESLDEAIEHVKRWIARDGQRRLGGTP